MKVPRSLKINKTVALTKKNCVTNAGQKVKVTAKKSKAFTITKVTKTVKVKKKKVTSTVWQIKVKKKGTVVLTWSAPGTTTLEAFTLTKTVKIK